MATPIMLEKLLVNTTKKTVNLLIYGGYFIIIITAQVAAPVMQDNCFMENREQDGPTTC